MPCSEYLQAVLFLMVRIATVLGGEYIDLMALSYEVLSEGAPSQCIRCLRRREL